MLFELYHVFHGLHDAARKKESLNSESKNQKEENMGSIKSCMCIGTLPKTREDIEGPMKNTHKELSTDSF